MYVYVFILRIKRAPNHPKGYELGCIYPNFMV